MSASPSLLNRTGLMLMLAGLCSGLFAAEPPARTFRIFTVVTAINGLKYDAAALQSFDLAIGQLPLTTYPVPADNHLVIYKEVAPPPGSPPGTPPVKLTQAEARIPPDAPRVLIAMIPQKAGPPAAMVITDDPGLHPAGRLRFLNLSRLETALGLDRNLTTLDPGRSALVDWKKGHGVLVQVAAQKGDRWQSVMRQERRSRPWARGYCFVFDYVPDPNQILPDPLNPPPATVRFFFENVPVDKAD